MGGETDLDRLMSAMSAKLHPEVHVFLTCAPDQVPPGLLPRMRFREEEGETLILTEAEARAAGLEGAFRCRMITLQVHSSLEAVGFIARIASALAAAGMGVNPVSGFFHDHLFVPADRAEEAMAILARLSSQA